MRDEGEGVSAGGADSDVAPSQAAVYSGSVNMLDGSSPSNQNTASTSEEPARMTIRELIRPSKATPTFWSWVQTLVALWRALVLLAY